MGNVNFEMRLHIIDWRNFKMKYCSKCGAEIHDDAVICTKCGCAVTGNMPAEDDTKSAGLIILSVLIPLFGIIYWAVKAKETPKRAKACGVAGLISWGVSLVLCIIIYAIAIGFAVTLY